MKKILKARLEICQMKTLTKLSWSSEQIIKIEKFQLDLPRKKKETQINNK